MSEVWTPLQTLLSAYIDLSRRQLLLVLVCTLAGSVASTAAPYLFSILVDYIVQSPSEKYLAWAFIFYAALMGIAYALMRGSGFLTFMAAESLNFVSSTLFFSRLNRKAADFFVENNSVEIEGAQQKGTRALNVLIQFVLSAILPGCIQLILALVLIGSTVTFSVALTLLVYGLIYIFLAAFVASRTRPHLENAIEHSQANARFVGNAISSMDTLRLFRSEAWMSNQFASRERSVLEALHRYASSQARFAMLFGFALAMQFLIGFWLLVPQVLSGDLTVGHLVLFNTLVLQLNVPFQMMGQAVQQIAQFRANFRPYARYWNYGGDREDIGSKEFKTTEGTIHFDNVGYVYPNGRGLPNISFSAARGRITFVNGGSGAGKSTLLKLLLKSMEPTSGVITIDGENLSAISRPAWLRNVAAVPQEIMLLNESLSSNIVLGRHYDKERLYCAAEKAAILPLVQSLEHGFDTNVGERGLRLSGGERQRISLARALYENPKVLLLDEPSSALDANNESEIIERLRLICDETTIICITHRSNLVRPIDTVVTVG